MLNSLGNELVESTLNYLHELIRASSGNCVTEEGIASLSN